MRNLDKIAAAIEAAKIELEDTIIYQATVFPETHDSEGRIIAPEEVWIYGGCSQEAWDRAFLEGSFSLNHLVVYRYQTRNEPEVPIIKTETNSEESEPYNPEEKMCEDKHEDCANSNAGKKCSGYEQKHDDTKPEYCPAVGGYCSNPYHQLDVNGCLDRQPDDWNGRCIY